LIVANGNAYLRSHTIRRNCISPLWPSGLWRRRPRKVVYTCVFGYYERFNDFEYDTTGDIDLVCFTDDPELVSKKWRIVLVKTGLLDPARTTRHFKTQPHRFFPDHGLSLYIDNSIRLKVSPKAIFDQYLVDSPSPYACFRHHERRCVYDEALKVTELRLDDRTRVEGQMALYRRLGYPANNGLAKNAFILRRHHHPALRGIMEDWFNQILCWSKRDQLSLNPVMWFHGFKPSYLPIKFSDFQLLEWPFADHARLPPDFEDARYRHLHPGVSINPRRHYLYEGAARGMPYK
jgi:hypothetical protein